MPATIGVRLEGGIGDHILGMRVLKFIRRRYPAHSIHVYSDCAGSAAQLQIASMSPLVDKVTVVYQDRERVTSDNIGSLENVRHEDRQTMMQHDVFIDTWTELLFTEAARILQVAPFDILASRPRLHVPSDYAVGGGLVDVASGKHYIAINLEKPTPDELRKWSGALKEMLLKLLDNPRLHILNLFYTNLDFPHWPEDMRAERRELCKEVAAILADFSVWSPRIIPLVNYDIAKVAAILVQCRYFIGVDNGIKHLAWALGIPRTFFLRNHPHPAFVLRYAPDFHRALLISEINEATISGLIDNVSEAIKKEEEMEKVNGEPRGGKQRRPMRDHQHRSRRARHR